MQTNFHILFQISIKFVFKGSVDNNSGSGNGLKRRHAFTWINIDSFRRRIYAPLGTDQLNRYFTSGQATSFFCIGRHIPQDLPTMMKIDCFWSYSNTGGEAIKRYVYEQRLRPRESLTVMELEEVALNAVYLEDGRTKTFNSLSHKLVMT